MGQGKSRENNALSKTTHFSTKEIDNLRQNVKTEDQNNITADVFKDSVKQCMPTVSMTDDAFLQRLYCAFGGDEENDQCLDFSKFVDGLSVFMKGTPEEKLKLSFKLYDVDKDEFISKNELEHVMLQLSNMMPDQDKQDEEIQRSIDCMFEDFDVDCDGKLVRKLKLFRSILFLLTHISFFFFLVF
jgi:Ca2+-binding EF-hand superfamily protein